MSTDSVTVQALSSPISAVISGPSGDVADNQMFTLSALASLDPDTPSAGSSGMQFEWSCMPLGLASSCFIDPSVTPPTSDSWTVDAYHMEPGQSNQFTVKVTKGSRSDSASVTITTKPAGTPTGAN